MCYKSGLMPVWGYIVFNILLHSLFFCRLWEHSTEDGYWESCDNILRFVGYPFDVVVPH